MHMRIDVLCITNMVSVCKSLFFDALRAHAHVFILSGFKGYCLLTSFSTFSYFNYPLGFRYGQSFLVFLYGFLYIVFTQFHSDHI
jgi:hypothetical protein